MAAPAIGQAEADLRPWSTDDLLAAVAPSQEERPLIGTYAQYKAVRQRGGNMSRFNLVMHVVGKDGACVPLPMPASRWHKWSATKGMHVADDLAKHPAEHARASAEFGAEMNGSAPQAASFTVTGDESALPAAPEVFYCRKDCGRFFDSEEARAPHERSLHKETASEGE